MDVDSVLNSSSVFSTPFLSVAEDFNSVEISALVAVTAWWASVSRTVGARR